MRHRVNGHANETRNKSPSSATPAPLGIHLSLCIVLRPHRGRATFTPSPKLLSLHTALESASAVHGSNMEPLHAPQSFLPNVKPGANATVVKSEPNDMVRDLRSLWPLIQKHGVTSLWIFGSHARGDFRPDSDLDLLVDFASPPGFDNFMGLKIDLEDRLGTKVDLLSRSACGSRFLRAIQPELLHVA